jgi:lipopolysaccharide/colanic/teichoic acid biosynthesis glycosyltransferase
MILNYNESSISIKGDHRITPFGAFLRRYKIDELPELWNVLIGDMSFVGPRPDVPGYADKLQGEERKILELRPGITGPASLKYSNEEEILQKALNPIQYNNEVLWPDKVRINLDYVKKQSFWKDVNLILKTIFFRNYTDY